MKRNAGSNRKIDGALLTKRLVCGKIHTMPKLIKPQDTKGAKATRNNINSLVFTVNEIMFPHYLSLIDMTVLLLVSKRLKRLMDAQKTIVQYICTHLNIPNVFKKGIKLSTILKKRAKNTIMYNLTTEENLCLSEACVSCLYCTRCAVTTTDVSLRSIRVAGCIHESHVCDNCIKDKVCTRPERDEFVKIRNAESHNNWNLLIEIDGNTGIVRNLNTQRIYLQKMKNLVRFSSVDQS